MLATYTSILFALIYIDSIMVFYNQPGGCWFNSLVYHSINRYSLVIVETTHDSTFLLKVLIPKTSQFII